MAVTALTCAAAIGQGTGLRDPDVFWHVRLGYELLAGAGADGERPGEGWSFLPSAGPWSSTEQLPELALALAHRSWGWAGPVWLRTITSALAALSLAGCLTAAARLGHALPPAGQEAVVSTPRSCAQAPAPRVAAIAALTAGVWTLLAFGQERPQQVSLIALPWCGLALACAGVFVARGLPVALARRPIAWAAVPCGTIGLWLWAQSHGLWLIVPAGLAAIAIAAVAIGAARRRAGPAARGALVLAAAALAIAVGTSGPVGGSALTAPWRLIDSTQHLSEWQPVDSWHPARWGWWVVLGASVFAALRARSAITWRKAATMDCHPVDPPVATHAGFGPVPPGGSARGPRPDLLALAAATITLAAAWGPARTIPVAVLLAAPCLALAEATTTRRASLRPAPAPAPPVATPAATPSGPGATPRAAPTATTSVIAVIAVIAATAAPTRRTATAVALGICAAASGIVAVHQVHAAGAPGPRAVEALLSDLRSRSAASPARTPWARGSGNPSEAIPGVTAADCARSLLRTTRHRALVAYNLVGEVLWLAPGWKVGLDPRMDRYSGATVRHWLAAEQGGLDSGELAATLRNWNVDVALVTTASRLGPQLAGLGWQDVAEANDVTLWTRCDRLPKGQPGLDQAPTDID